MGKISAFKGRVLTGAAVAGIVVGAALSGAGPVSASAAAAPPGYAGPFSGDCNGTLVRTLPLSDGSAEIKVWYDSSGSGTYCAKTYDNRAGDHDMEIRLRHYGWATWWNDTGTYATYAGGIYVSQANTYCTYVSGWVVVNGTKYSQPETLICDE